MVSMPSSAQTSNTGILTTTVIPRLPASSLERCAALQNDGSGNLTAIPTLSLPAGLDFTLAAPVNPALLAAPSSEPDKTKMETEV